MAQSRKQKPARGPNMKPFYIALAVIAVAGIAWIGYSLSGAGETAALAPVELAGMDDAQQLVNTARGVAIGEADAPVKVLVFSDFTCPACRNFSSIVEPQLKSEYVQQGLVQFTYYDFPLGGDGPHRHGFIGARAARCAEAQGRFWEYHDVLFARQDEWRFARSAPISEMVEYAGLIGLDTGAFESCIDSDAHADVVSANRLLGEQFGVNATPTVYVGPRQLPNWGDWDGFKATIEAQLPAGARGGAGAAPRDTASGGA